MKLTNVTLTVVGGINGHCAVLAQRDSKGAFRQASKKTAVVRRNKSFFSGFLTVRWHYTLKTRHVDQRSCSYDKMIHFTAYSVTHHTQAMTVMRIRQSNRLYLSIFWGGGGCDNSVSSMVDTAMSVCLHLTGHNISPPFDAFLEYIPLLVLISACAFMFHI